MTDLGWLDRAACRGMDTETWYPERGHAPTALWYCARCPVALECLELALRCESPSYRYGIWGGLRPEQRAKL